MNQSGFVGYIFVIAAAIAYFIHIRLTEGMERDSIFGIFVSFIIYAIFVVFIFAAFLGIITLISLLGG